MEAVTFVLSLLSFVCIWAWCHIASQTIFLLKTCHRIVENIKRQYRNKEKTLKSVIWHVFQPVFFPVDTNFNGLFRNRSISPNSLLETTISEEVRQEKELEDEIKAYDHPICIPSNTSRRHTLAEVTTHFYQHVPPCK